MLDAGYSMLDAGGSVLAYLQFACDHPVTHYSLRHSMPKQLDILALEPYMTGSHKSFLDGLKNHSEHRIEISGLPGRKWKWRMRASAIGFAQEVAAREDTPELILASDYLDVAAFRALLPTGMRDIPILTYFHENQLTYPVQDETERDYQFVFTNITTCLASNRVLFNSAFHREQFIEAIPEFFKRMPDHVPAGVDKEIRAKSGVQHLGIEPPGDLSPSETRDGPPILAWNHRWEYDKNPDLFFHTLFELDAKGVDFQLVVLGESFVQTPQVFEEAKEKLAHRILHYGFAESREDYWRLLKSADIIVSTSIHDFFGLSVVEGIAAGCFPVLPMRLAYPELLPHTVHADCFFKEDDEFAARLEDLLIHPLPPIAMRLKTAAEGFEWRHRVPDYDREFEHLVTSRL
jgi:glycosyltransferase involved in cell wall biosynthesis